MRHFLARGPAAAAVAGLPGGVVQASAPAVLVPTAGGVERGAPRPLGTGSGAVAISPITVPAEEEDLAALAPSADHEPKGIHASLRTGRRGGQSRSGVRSQSRAGSRVPVCGIQPEGPGWSDSGPSPFSASAGPLYLRTPSTATSQQSRGRPGPRHRSRIPRFPAITNTRRPPPARRPRSGAAGPAQGPDRRLPMHMRRPAVLVQDPPLLSSRASAYRPSHCLGVLPARPVRHAASFPVLSVTPV